MDPPVAVLRFSWFPARLACCGNRGSCVTCARWFRESLQWSAPRRGPSADCIALRVASAPRLRGLVILCVGAAGSRESFPRPRDVISTCWSLIGGEPARAPTSLVGWRDDSGLDSVECGGLCLLLQAFGVNKAI